MKQKRKEAGKKGKEGGREKREKREMIEMMRMMGYEKQKGKERDWRGFEYLGAKCYLCRIWWM